MIESEYRKADGINYSLLKQVADSPYSIINKKDISNLPSVKQGNLLDTRMEGLDLFDENYVYFDGEIPTATTLKLANAVIASAKTMGITPDTSFVLSLIEEVNSSDCDPTEKYWAATKTTGTGDKEVTQESKFLMKFDDALFWKYVNFHFDHPEKLMITKEIYDNVNDAHDLLKTHEFTTGIFDRELIFQKDIYFTMKLAYRSEVEEDKDEILEVDFKILPDMITIDHEAKIIYPYDFKFLNGASPHKFWSYFFQKKYYIQSSLYSMGVKRWAAENYPEYKSYPYQFLVVGDKNLSYPLIFNPINFITLGFEGFDRNGINHPGIKQLVKDYDWHLENNLWEHTRELYESKGVINLRM